MAINDNSQVQYESAADPQDWEAMTDSGDRTKFTSSFSPWSQLSTAGTVVRPYGRATGGVISIAASGSNDVVDITAMTLYMPGNAGSDADGLVSVSAATDHAVTRPVTNDYMITAITVNSSGALANVAGTEDASGFSSTRGATGGPPLIPDGSVEIGWVKYSSTTSAAVVANEIQQVQGTSLETSDFPVWDVDYVNGEVTFSSALPATHTGSIPKQVWVTGGTPVFASVARASDYVPAETSYAVNSTPTYDGPIGSSTSSIGQASFSAILDNGITDAILNQEGETVWIKFFQDRDKAPYQLTQGKLGYTRSFAVDENVTAAFTVTPEVASVNKAS